MRLFPTPTASNVQPIKNSTPPIGVIAPNILMPLTAKIYKLPEKKIIPKVIVRNDHFKGDASPTNLGCIKMPTKMIPAA